MGLFEFFNSYNKAGPGVDKDEPPKAAPIRFFEIYFRKFSKLVQANLIFCLPSLVTAILMGAIYLFVPHITLTLPGTEATINITTMYLMMLPLILLMPFTAGLTVITRNFAREEHAFLWSDFWDTVKSNWKLFLANGFICYIVYFLLSFSIWYYYTTANYVPFWFCIVLALIFIIAQYYIPMMLITFDLKLGQVYKNALIFVLAGFGRNLLITAILAILVILIPFPNTTLGFTIFLALAVVWLFSFVSYLINFTIYPVIDKYMIQPYQKRMATVPQGEKLADPFTAEELPKSEYVYHNGKLVKRSELEDSE